MVLLSLSLYDSDDISFSLCPCPLSTIHSTVNNWYEEFACDIDGVKYPKWAMICTNEIEIKYGTN